MGRVHGRPQVGGGQNGHLPPVKIGIKNQNFLNNFKSAA